MIKKAITLFVVLFITLIPCFCFAQENNNQILEQTFEAKVLEVLAEKQIVRPEGSIHHQQNVKCIGLKGEWKDKDFIVIGINDLDVVSAVVVKKGDKVVISYSKNFEGKDNFVIIDQVRRGAMYVLALIFILITIIVGRWKGFISILNLGFTLLVIMGFILPNILKGRDPLLFSLIGSIIILSLIIYLTWGWKIKAHIAMLSISISLFFTGVISIIFTQLTKLGGLTNDEVLNLVGINGVIIDFRGLLLAGIIIGTLGVIDDVIISQISTIEQLKLANPNLTKKELFKRGLNVGIDHISSMVNTLFLAYAGASLPLLLLFKLRTEPFVTATQVFNNEMIATEIVRTLTGSIGLILAVPLATYFAVKWLKIKKT